MEGCRVANSARARVSLTVLGFLAVFLSWTAVSAPAVGLQAQTIAYSIEAGDAPATLSEFSRQSNAQVLFDFKILSHIKTKPLKGSYPTNEALARILRGTGLKFDWVDDRTVAIMPSKAHR